MSSDRKTIAVVGGAGFIGANLCMRLLSQGQKVICIDNFSTGSKTNLISFYDNPHFTLLEHDIIHPFQVDADVIYNLASPASPNYFYTNPVQVIKSCVLGTVNIAELALQQKCKVFHASSSEIYGDPVVMPQTETYYGNVNSAGERSSYQEGKRCSEAILFAYHNQHKLEIKIARLFNAYGPLMRSNDSRVMSSFITRGLLNKDLEIWGDGSQIRSFCYIDDLLEGMLLLMNTPFSFAGPINLGTTETVTILDLARQILSLLNSKSGITFKERRPDDPQRRQPDIRLARRILKWNPKISLDEGLRSTIEFFRESSRNQL